MNVLLFAGLTVFVISSVTCFRFLLGPGRWLVLNTMPCEDPDQYDIIFTVKGRKINRTHDCFTISFVPKVELEDIFAYGIQIDVYKEVDGGFKFYQTFADPCGCKFIKRHARSNMERALTLAGIDPPDCPLPKEPFEIKDFVMDYRELPKLGVYGTFDTRVFMTLKKKKVGCGRITLNFDDQRDDDYDD